MTATFFTTINAFEPLIELVLDFESKFISELNQQPLTPKMQPNYPSDMKLYVGVYSANETKGRMGENLNFTIAFNEETGFYTMNDPSGGTPFSLKWLNDHDFQTFYDKGSGMSCQLTSFGGIEYGLVRFHQTPQEKFQMEFVTLFWGLFYEKAEAKTPKFLEK